MKKSLLISATAICAAMSMNAEERVYDFHQVAPQLAIDLYAPEEDPYYGYGKSGNVDLIDKTGVPGAGWLENPTSLQTKVDEQWTVDTSKLLDMETGELVDRASADPSHTFIGWGEKGVARTLIMAGWGDLDGAIGENYQAATQEDYVATKNALAFNRNANSGCRVDTYFQMPAFQGPFTMDLYLGTAGGKYVAGGINCKVVPVVDGVEGEATKIGKADGEYTYKRMYKFTYTYDKTDAPIMRVGCDGDELNIYHIVLKSADGAGVENVALDAAAENAPIYNTLGVQVDENYKGLVIKGGKKYIQK